MASYAIPTLSCAQEKILVAKSPHLLKKKKNSPSVTLCLFHFHTHQKCTSSELFSAKLRMPKPDTKLNVETKRHISGDD